MPDATGAENVPGTFARICPQHFLNFFPLPQGQKSFLPVFTLISSIPTLHVDRRYISMKAMAHATGLCHTTQNASDTPAVVKSPF